MKINVILITYNHSQYIRQALDGLIIQDVPCDVEVIVADDASSDDTISIIKEYAKTSSFEFRFFPKTDNLGFIKNYKRAFDACSGDYIALLEGDDYWNSPHHIYNHIQFLEKHSECSMSYNRHIRFWVDENRYETPEWSSEQDYELITSERMALGNCIGNLSCCVFRTRNIRRMNQQIFDMEFADWLLGMVMGQYGPLAYQKEITSVYRIHGGGQWSRMTEEEQTHKLLETIDIYDKFLDNKYTKEFILHKKRLRIRLYGDKSLKGWLKKITPVYIHKLYRKLRD